MSTNPQITFKTDFFKPISGEDKETNPGRFGKALAQWLTEHLKLRGVAVEGVIPEDFGWVIMLSRKPFLLWLSCGNTDGSTTEWSIFPVAEVSTLQRLFNPADPAPEIEKLKVHLSELVLSIPGVSDVTWD
ncbi:hypothetical protein [Undibacterium sp. Ren11W]|uniref:hypothetical protein n=1 Tax=Undibacterium sp. Ren11W TaxID=3413045 RepID=UPI003BF1FB89